MTYLLAIAAGLAVGVLVERYRARHRLAQIVDVDAVRAEIVDQGALEAQLAEQTMRAARFHRLWRYAQQIARDQAELLVAGRRPAIPLGPPARHMRSVVPLYGAERLRVRRLRGAS